MPDAVPEPIPDFFSYANDVAGEVFEMERLDNIESTNVDATDDNQWTTPFQRAVMERLDNIESTQDAVKNGVNVIGEMMNGVATVFDDLMQKVQQGGIGSLLGGLMGGKKTDG